MIDLSSLPSFGKAKLIKMFPKKEKEETDISISWELEVMIDIDTMEKSIKLDKLIKGASSVYIVGKEGGKSEIKDETSYEVVSISIFNASKSKVLSGHCKLLRTIVRSRGVNCVCIMKFIVYGVLPINAANLSIELNNDIYLYICSTLDKTLSDFTSASSRFSKSKVGNLIYLNHGNNQKLGVINSSDLDKITALCIEKSQNFVIVKEYHDIILEDIEEVPFNIRYDCRPKEFIDSLAGEINDKNQVDIENPLSFIVDYIGKKFATGERPENGFWLIGKEEIKNIVKMMNTKNERLHNTQDAYN